MGLLFKIVQKNIRIYNAIVKYGLVLCFTIGKQTVILLQEMTGILHGFS